MKIGIQAAIMGGHVPAVRQAVKVAELGFESIYAGEHTHLPVSTPLPEFYETEALEVDKYVPDPLLCLCAMAMAAPKLRIGTSILMLPIHDTIMLAQRIGTLDDLTGGRTQFGIGVGWNPIEMAHHGCAFETRNEKMVEQLRALKALWSNDAAGFDGEFVKFEESWVGPKPVQKPHPPIILGGRPLKRNFAIIAELCDGWFPTDTNQKTYGGNLEEQLERLAGVVHAAGRDPRSLKHTYLFAELLLYDRNPSQYAEDAPTRDQLAYYEKLGFERVVIGVPSHSEEHFLGALHHLSGVAQPWLFQD